MTSIFGSRNRHLDTSGGREVVFCHACRHEWYRDQQQGLQCPSCGSEITEIVEAASDPREDREFPSPIFSFGRTDRNRSSDSDPEIDDIEDHFGSPFYQRRPPRQGAGAQSQGDGDAILRRFADMLMNDLGAARPNRGGPDSLFPPSPSDDVDRFGMFPPPGTRANGGPTTVHRTFRSGPVSGSATFTIISGSGPADGSAMPAFPPGFPTLFSQIFNNATPPNGDDPSRSPGAGAGPIPPAGGRPGPGFGLHDLLASLLNPAAAVHGDAVYTQEALDRIITSLMEANPQSNAAPPASQAAIDGLEKKQVDEKMLGAEGKAECTICIDELKKGDEVTVLPCTHWFHGECVTLWLREHNTCPICRAPIEQGTSQGGSQSGSSRQTPQPQSPSQTSAFSMPSSIFGQQRSRPERFPRSPRENQDRLDAIRNLSNYRNADSGAGLPRRNSLSPVSSRPDGTFRSRARSPSSSRDQDAGVSPYDRGDYFVRRYSGLRENREARERENQSSQNQPSQSGGHGPLSWLRDHLGRGSGSNSDRDRRR